jgi:hypothetical protein
MHRGTVKREAVPEELLLAEKDALSTDMEPKIEVIGGWTGEGIRVW